jgi:hypothetical protein
MRHYLRMRLTPTIRRQIRWIPTGIPIVGGARVPRRPRETLALRSQGSQMPRLPGPLTQASTDRIAEQSRPRRIEQHELLLCGVTSTTTDFLLMSWWVVRKSEVWDMSHAATLVMFSVNSPSFVPRGASTRALKLNPRLKLRLRRIDKFGIGDTGGPRHESADDLAGRVTAHRRQTS